jgi:hypothetical protein
LGLEKLKSVFAEGAGVNKSQISDRYSEDEIVQPMEGIFGNRNSEVNFFSGTNSYRPTLDPSISGFTKNFNLGGYAFADGQPGNSKYLDILSNTQTMVNNIDITSLGTSKLGYGDFQTPDFEGNDIRFTAGYGYPFANTILQVSKEGNGASLWYTTTDGKVSVGASGAVNNFGPISDLADSIGFDIPPLDFSVDIISSKPLRYEDTIWEKSNFTPQDMGETLPPGYLGNQRGIAFQTISPNVNRGKALKFSAPGLGPISTLNDLYEGPKAGHGAERGTTATEEISKMNTGLHLYLGNQTSFVKLGPDIYQGSILDALRAGDIAYVKEKAIEFALGVGEKILDKSGDILATAGKNMADWASGISIKTPELPKLTTLVGQFSLKGLKGPSVDLASFGSMGGMFDGLKLKHGFNLSLSNLPKLDINLPDIKFPSIPSIPSLGGTGMGGAFTSWGISLPPFPKTSIKNNPDLLDLLETIRNDTTAFAKAQLGFQQGLLGDGAGADGSLTDNANPRGLTAKPGIKIENPLPYKQLGTSKYTDAIISKHPTNSDVVGEQGPLPLSKVSSDFYPSTLDKGDFKTLLPAGAGNTLEEAGEGSVSNYVDVAQGEKYGLPFYFKDLRDNKYIIFRGYLSGMTQNVSPEWTEHSYLGRSESTYVYSKAKRNINFTFKVYATTKPELQLIYEKLNLLTSLAYPRYKTPGKGALQEKNRMMPPMCSLRIGELFGNNSKNVTGFLDSLNFNWPDETTWEIEKGKRVPKECDVTVGFTVIHRTPPHHETPADEFFGLGFK